MKQFEITMTTVISASLTIEAETLEEAQEIAIETGFSAYGGNGSTSGLIGIGDVRDEIVDYDLSADSDIELQK